MEAWVRCKWGQRQHIAEWPPTSASGAVFAGLHRCPATTIKQQNPSKAMMGVAPVKGKAQNDKGSPPSLSLQEGC